MTTSPSSRASVVDEDVAGPLRSDEINEYHEGSLRWHRPWAMLIKEFLMISRDRVTLANMIAVPLTLLLLHAYALSTTPRNLATAWIVPVETDLSVTFRSALERTGYFRIVRSAQTVEQVDHWIRSGEVAVAIEISADAERLLRRGERAQILVAADATDPVAMAYALASLEGVRQSTLAAMRSVAPAAQADTAHNLEILSHRRFNPSGSTRLHIVPSLLGIILNITMMIFASLAVTRETERGTMEGLLAMPINPFEIMIGKMLPYVIVGLGQAILIIAVSIHLFKVPIVGSIALLLSVSMVFILANLSFGYTFSTLAQNQLQVIQMTFMFFLPSLLLSGSLLPFEGMPAWAQAIGETLPLTHFNRISRSIMLKGSTLDDIGYDASCVGAATIVAVAIAMMRYKRTLD